MGRKGRRRNRGSEVYVYGKANRLKIKSTSRDTFTLEVPTVVNGYFSLGVICYILTCCVWFVFDL